MAKFLTTVGNSFYIEQIILNADKNLTLVTPYLNLSKNLIDRLTDADKENIKITLIYGKNELSKSEEQKIDSLKNIDIYFCKNLHAKCYLNEESLIITSMNLYEFSERNNREMGILIERKNDEKIFKDTLKEIESIKNSSVLQKSSKKDNDQDLVYLSDEHNERWNFFYPSLYRVLKQKLKEFHITYDKENCITINNCPSEGVEIVISGRVDFNFDNNSFFYYVKRKCMDDLEKTLPEIRFYWNRKCINIYPEKNFDVQINQKGLEQIVDKYSSMTLNTLDKVTNAQSNYGRPTKR